MLPCIPWLPCVIMQIPLPCRCGSHYLAGVDGSLISLLLSLFSMWTCWAWRQLNHPPSLALLPRPLGHPLTPLSIFSFCLTTLIPIQTRSLQSLSFGAWHMGFTRITLPVSPRFNQLLTEFTYHHWQTATSYQNTYTRKLPPEEWWGPSPLTLDVGCTAVQ